MDSWKTTSLKIDFREQQSGIVEELNKFNGYLTIEICHLPTGDYRIGDQILIERKTLTDFLESIKTGRIFQQAYRMAQSEEHAIIILEGDKSTVSRGLMTRRAVQGALVHLTVFLGIPVIRSLNIRETASLLRDISLQSRKQTLPRQKQLIPRCPGILLSKKQRQKLFLLRNLPGIGLKKALALLRSFGTIENILNATPAELTKVKGIGWRLARRIFTILHEPFQEV